MQYFSTNRISPVADFRKAVLQGQPADKGLYFPDSIPRLSERFLREFRKMQNGDIAFAVIKPYVDGAISDDALRHICFETVDFEFPLVPVTDRISALELFHGPTLAFKDVGARFMSRCLQHFVRDRKKKTVVIVATSGDTGGAVAAGFHGVEGVEVVILYPKGKVSRIQELQLTTLGGNVSAIRMDGAFDDCQRIAKRALADEEIQNKVFLTSANSINIARWLPQQFYYFFALKQWEGDPPVFSVPSGNFGNICAGILANASGMPTDGFIAACNANAVVPEFLETGEYRPRRSVETLSNAMDVGDPSNFVRLLEIFGEDLPRMKESIRSVSVSDEATVDTIRSVFDETGYVLDPHGAVGFKALSDRLAEMSEQKGIFLETAHPIKFDSVDEILGTFGDAPSGVAELMKKESTSIDVPNAYDAFREILLSKI